MTILDEILREKEKEVTQLLTEPIHEKRIHEIERPSLLDRIQNANQLQVIAEMKRASPSKGMIKEGANPVEQAKIYERAGAVCVSVLTDSHFFKGSFDDLASVAKVIGIPILCKDFIIHPIQIDRAKQAGASVILLIVAALPDADLKALHAYAKSRGLEVLVEVHDRTELTQALEIGAQLIGVNNRDLRTFEVDLARTEEIARVFPFDSNHVLISESGITGKEDAERAAAAGAGAVLVGEALMRSLTPNHAIAELQVKRMVNEQ
ncbi:indole-3-glycerol phosphate synthase TrpC [Sporosarcina aquimarina]|uniref:Indole-3-glycerol phosphate synthase n=1 Tax=Sporosarcina aquimarina TaxID=114975 RepID=A0ABU4G0L2_9BACL|nr:indole-3-glycerol phosphate synthase TrpC [Sporosarcina aquimarina]MDW0109915.1 indole-3-glycerol phosphate synthase TrpC [Sporosarcina aquimarina]